MSAWWAERLSDFQSNTYTRYCDSDSQNIHLFSIRICIVICVRNDMKFFEIIWKYPSIQTDKPKWKRNFGWNYSNILISFGLEVLLVNNIRWHRRQRQIRPCIFATFVHSKSQTNKQNKRAIIINLNAKNIHTRDTHKKRDSPTNIEPNRYAQSQSAQ